MSNPLFAPEVRLMLQENNAADIQAFCESLHPATVAETLAEEISADDSWKFLQHADIKTQAAIFEYFPIEWQVKMVEGSGQQQMARLIEKMSHDDRGDLIRRLRPRVAEGVLRLVDEADRRDIATLAAQKPRTAGALMTTDYAWVPGTITVAEAFDRLRLQAPDSETIYYVYVLDEHRKLQGVMTLRKMVLAPRHALIRDVMETTVVTLGPGDPQSEVAKSMARYDLLAIPVVDVEHGLLGIVTHDDAIDVVVEEATDDVLKFGGVGEGALDQPYFEMPLASLIRKRAGWLVILFLGEMLTATAMGFFEKEIERAVVLALFVPLIISSGGNSGSQAATIIIRAMALGEVRLKQWWFVMRREILSGLALGLILATIGFLRIAVWSVFSDIYGPHWIYVAWTVSLSLIGVVSWGTLSGSMLPLLLRRLRLDPATSSAPFVATLVDVTGLVIYFTVALVSLRGVELQKPIIVSVDAAGVLVINGEEVPFDELEERMTAVVEKYERRPVQFRADASIIPERLLEIYETMTKAGASKLELRALPNN